MVLYEAKVQGLRPATVLDLNATRKRKQDIMKTGAILLTLASLTVVVDAVSLVPRAGAPCPNSQYTANNPKCCALYPVVDDLQSRLFKGICHNELRKVLRTVFHDAIGFSRIKGGGGADGSIFTFRDVELNFPGNRGMKGPVEMMDPFLSKWNDVSPGDMINLAIAVGLTNCKGAPRVPFFMGRPPPKAASPPGLLPAETDSVTSILLRFADAGFTPGEVVALMGAHSMADSDHLDPSASGAPFDSTPNEFDSQFYLETQLKGTSYPGTSSQGQAKSSVKGVMRLLSDHRLARDPRTTCQWQSMIDNQERLKREFSDVMFKLSLVGQKKSALTDCSEVIPPARSEMVSVSYPPTLSRKDVEHVCLIMPFPKLATRSGPPLVVPPLPGHGDDEDD